MKLFTNLLVVAAAASLTSVAMAAPKKGADAKGNECFVCKVNEETVEIQGKTCFTTKEKKKANKECTKQKGKWVQDTTASATGTGTEEAPSEEMPME